MDDITKNVIAMLIFVILLGAMGVTLFMIIKVQTTDDKVLGDEYVIPVQIANAIISVVLSYIVATDESISGIYKLFVILLVLASIGGEIYYTGYVDRKFETTPTDFPCLLEAKETSQNVERLYQPSSIVHRHFHICQPHPLNLHDLPNHFLLW